MSELIPLYFATLDGEDPCAWSPFGTPMKQMEQGKKEIMKSNYSNSKQFTVSIVCRKHELLADEAISQTIGCLIDTEYLKPEQKKYIDAQFLDFSNRLADLDKGLIDAVGFEIYFIASDGSSDCDYERAMDFKKRLIVTGFREKNIRVDLICDQSRLKSISKLRLVNVSHTRGAVKLPKPAEQN